MVNDLHLVFPVNAGHAMKVVKSELTRFKKLRDRKQCFFLDNNGRRPFLGYRFGKLLTDCLDYLAEFHFWVQPLL